MILQNARVYTLDPKRPFARALATRGDRILYVGGNEEFTSRIHDDPETLDLEGKTVLPGFIDSHVHFLWGGQTLLRPSFRGVRSADQLLAVVVETVQGLSPGQWVIGEDLDPNAWAGAELPNIGLVDRVSAENPVIIRQTDGHSVLVNSPALKLAGIAPETPDPPGGEIGRDPATGELTGFLRDAAMDIVFRWVPPAGEREKEEAFRRATREAIRSGVTTVHDMGSLDDAAFYLRMLEKGELRTRISLYHHETSGENGLESIFHGPQSPPWIRIAGLKAFIDGSLGSRTALFSQPYLDRPGWCGIYDRAAIPLDRFAAMLRRADRRGLQLAVHAIGDRAVHELLDTFTRITERNGPRDRRFRVEHAQHLLPGDFTRFAHLGAIASVQPSHIADDGRWAENAIGKDRCRGAYAFRSFLDAGARLAFGSDWPVASLDPLAAIRAAVARRTGDGKNPDGWFPEQKIGVLDAVRAFTSGAAYAEFIEDEKGSLEAGKLADLVVLSHDILADPDALSDARVEMTMVGGILTRARNGE